MTGRVRRNLAIAGAALLAVIALLAAYATLRGVDRQRAAPGQETTSPAGAYGREPGPNGERWRWLRHAGTIEISGHGKRWLAFRAKSLKRARSLRFSSDAGDAHAVVVSAQPELRLVGPFEVDGRTTIDILASPGPQQASRADPRRLSVFLSPIHVTDAPAYAEPTKGFFRAEDGGRSGSFRWMGNDGRIELVADPSSVNRVWLSFPAQSQRMERELVVTDLGNGQTIQREAPASASGRLAYGPYALVAPRLTFGLSARPGARPLTATDHRRASVRLFGIDASDRQPTTSTLGTTAAVGLLLLLGAGLALAAWLLARRQTLVAALYLIGMTAPLEVYRAPFAGTNLSVFRLSVLTALVVVLMHGRQALVRVALSRIAIAYGALAGVTALSTILVASDRTFGLRLLAIMAVGITAIAVTGALGVRTSLRATCRAFTIGAVLPLLAAAWQSLAPVVGLDPGLPFIHALPTAEGLEVTRLDVVSLSRSVLRLKGTFGDPNHLGAYLVVCTPIALGVALDAAIRARRDMAVLAGGVAVATTITLVATYSRSALLGACGGVVVLASVVAPTIRRLLPPTGNRARRWAALGVVALGVAVCAPLAPTVVNRLNPSADVNTVTNAGHRSTAEAALDSFRDHPLLGAGPGELGRRLGQGTRTSGAHSSYLTVAAELGLLGLLAMLTAIGVTIGALGVAVRAGAPRADAILPASVLAAYVSFVIASVFYDLWWDDFHWLLLGVVTACVAAPRVASPARRAGW